MNRRIILLIVLAAVALLSVFLVVNYFTTTRTLVVRYENARDVALTDPENSEVVASAIANNQEIRISAEKDYVVTYRGEEGYADGSERISPSTNEVTISPDYSEARRQAIFEESLDEIRGLLLRDHPLSRDYFTVTTGDVFDKGAWLAAKLDYKGEYGFNSDNLIVLFKREDESWVFASEPSIVLTLKNTQGVPRDILVKANQLQLSDVNF